jgi:hypothetical protein
VHLGFQPIANPLRANLITAWIKIYGYAPPKGISTRLLVLAALYNEQARKLGGLKLSTRKALRSIASGNDIGKNRGGPSGGRKNTYPGTRLVREWRGETHVVDVGKDGIVYKGRGYKSLSHVAKAITGAHWSGPRFFGV